MLSVADIPKEWVELLTDLQSIHRKVVIAGGALRDLDHGLAPKDIDIFIGCGDGKEAEGLNELMGGGPSDDHDEQWYQGSNAEIILVTDGPMVGGLQSQFIFINWNVFKIVDRFDYTLCQIMFDGKTITTTQRYRSDKDEKVFRVVRSANASALGRSVERYARWKPKFPDHRWCLSLDNMSDFGLSA